MGGVSRFSPSGTPLPAASTPPEFQCCTNREHLPRIAAHASGTYASLTMQGYPNDVFYVGWEMDALGALTPGGWQVDSTLNGNGTTRAGHGGAVATLDGRSIHLVWDDTTATVIGRRLNAAPGVGGTRLVAGPSDPDAVHRPRARFPGSGSSRGGGRSRGSRCRATLAVFFDVNAMPGPLFTLSADTVLRNVLVRSPRGDRLALVGTRASGGSRSRTRSGAASSRASTGRRSAPTFRSTPRRPASRSAPMRPSTSRATSTSPGPRVGARSGRSGSRPTVVSADRLRDARERRLSGRRYPHDPPRGSEPSTTRGVS